jgi:hypothetical protein
MVQLDSRSRLAVMKNRKKCANFIVRLIFQSLKPKNRFMRVQRVERQDAATTQTRMISEQIPNRGEEK